MEVYILKQVEPYTYHQVILGVFSTEALAEAEKDRLVKENGDLPWYAVDEHPVDPVTCPYTFAHTRHWCGNPTCRDS